MKVTFTPTQPVPEPYMELVKDRLIDLGWEVQSYSMTASMQEKMVGMTLTVLLATRSKYSYSR